MMVNGCVDSRLLECPVEEDGQAAFEAFINGLVRWHDIWLRREVKVLTSLRTHEVLAAAGRYPMWEPVARLLDRYGLRHVQAKDVISIAHAFLSRATPIEDVVGLVDFLIDASDFTLKCSEELKLGGRAELLVHLVVAMALLAETRGEPDDRYLLLSRDGGHDSLIEVSGVVMTADGPMCRSADWPVRVNRRFRVVEDPVSVLSHFDLGAIWVAAIDRRDEFVVSVAIEEALRRHPAGDQSDRPWSVGVDDHRLKAVESRAD